MSRQPTDHSWEKARILEITWFTNERGVRIWRYTFNDMSLILSRESHKRLNGGRLSYYLNNPSKFFNAKFGQGIIQKLQWPPAVQREFIQQFWQRCSNLQRQRGKGEPKDASDTFEKSHRERT